MWNSVILILLEFLENQNCRGIKTKAVPKRGETEILFYKSFFFTSVKATIYTLRTGSK